MMRLWGTLFHPQDSQGRESRTLFFVAVTILFLWAALGLVLWKFMVAPVEIMAFATAVVTLCGGVATVIGIWLGREYIRK
jgi:sterol desaturase/sphingolipid hydroxylase (fatty acid hydroxylase superfamily)